MADETEEFEFRARAEREAAAQQPSQPLTPLTAVRGAVDIAGTGLMNIPSSVLNAPWDIASRVATGKGYQMFPKFQTGPEAQALRGAVGEAVQRANVATRGLLSPEAQRVVAANQPMQPSENRMAIFSDIGTLAGAYGAAGAAREMLPAAVAQREFLERGAMGRPGPAGQITRAAPPGNPITLRAAEQAHEAGYVISPRHIGGEITRGAQQIAGLPKTDEEFSAVNEPHTADLARSDIRLPANRGMGIDDTEYARREEELFEPFIEARAMTPRPEDTLPFDDEVLQEVGAAGSRYARPGEPQSYGPSPYAKEIEPLINQYRVDRANIGQTIDHIRDLRRDAAANFNGPYNPVNAAKGLAQRNVADALEAWIERIAANPQRGARLQPRFGGPVRILQAPGAALPWEAPQEYLPARTTAQAAREFHSEWGLGEVQGPVYMPRPNPGLVARIRDSRVQLAKLHQYRESTGAGGMIDARDFAKRLQAYREGRGPPLTGNSLVIARTAEAFPHSMQPIVSAGKGQHGRFSVIDYWIGGTGVISGHPGLTAMTIARPVTRYGLRTAPVQRRMLRGYRRRLEQPNLSDMQPPPWGTSNQP
jgi:hypothetical protein